MNATKRVFLTILMSVCLLAGCGSSSSTPGAVGQAPASTVPAGSTSPGFLVVSQQGKLLRLDRAGQNAFTLTQGFNDRNPAFRPDGADLIFVRQSADGSGPSDIFRVRPDGSGLQNLTPDFNFEVADVNYSWDGNTIVFSAKLDSNDQDIFLMNADGTGVTRVTTGPEIDAHPAFSEDGRTIVFERDNGISQVATSGGPVTDLTDGTFVDTYPSYCPPGNIIVFSRNGDLWTIENQRLTQVTNTPNAAEFQAQHAPELGKIYALTSTNSQLGAPRLQSNQQPVGDITVLNPDGSQSQVITNNLGASHVTAGGGSTASTPWAARGPYPASFSPFSHTVGICYGHFEGRTGTVSGDLDQLTQSEGFQMLHIYNYFNTGTNDLTVDADMKAVLDYAVAHNLEVLLGTKNSLVVSGGLLQTPAGATQYVTALKTYLDSGVIKVIALANEPNAKGAANIAPDLWGKAATNLRTALTTAGYTDMPISACLVFGGLTSYPPANAVFQEDNASYSMLGYMQAINQVNSTKPFVFVNILPSYTVNSVVAQNPGTAPWYPAFGTFASTTNPASNDGNLAPYWNLADLQYNCVINALSKAGLAQTQVYVSESGWPSSDGGTYDTPPNQVSFINGLLSLWTPQARVPVFVFEAYDEPLQGPGLTAWGIHDKLNKLKSGIILPSPLDP
jgi:glycosyl hydrolase family 17/WD40 repeat protein